MSGATGRAGSGQGPWHCRAPNQKNMGGAKAPRKSFRGEVHHGPKVEHAIVTEAKPASLGTIATNNSRKSKHRGAKGGMTHPNPQQRTANPSQSSQLSRSSLGTRVQPSGTLSATVQEKITPTYPILPIGAGKVSACDSGVSQSGTPSTSEAPYARPRHLPSFNAAETKTDTPQLTTGTGGTRHKDMKHANLRLNPSLPSTTRNILSVPLVEPVKRDIEIDAGTSRTPTATIWKEPLLPSTYPRDSKHKKEKTQVKLTRPEPATTSPSFGTLHKECPSPPTGQPRRKAIQTASRFAITPKTPKPETSPSFNSRRTFPPIAVHATIASCSENVADDAEGWELTIASQILNHGPRWEQRVQELPYIESLSVIVTDSSTPKPTNATKENIPYSLLNDDELMQRCWDEKWTWSQFEEAMGFQGWEYKPVSMDGQDQRLVGGQPQQDPHSSEDNAIHPRMEVGPDEWQKSRLSCDFSVAQALDAPPTPHLATTPERPGTTQVISPSAPETCGPLNLEEVTKLHSPYLHNDNVYWIDGVTYAYFHPTQASRKQQVTISTSKSPEHDVEGLDSYEPAVSPGDPAVVQIPHWQTNGDSQPNSQVQVIKNANLKTKKVILRIRRPEPPLTPPAQADASGINQPTDVPECNQENEIKAERVPLVSPCYTEMLYSESIPSMDWVLGHPPYNNFFPVIGCEGYSVAEAQIYDNRSTFADEDNPASDLDTAADQAWRLWVSTIGDVTSIRRTMKYPDSLIPTEHEEQHHMAPPPEISDIVEQVFQPQIESPSTDDLAQAQGLEPTINLPSLDVMVREILLLPAISDDFLVTSCHLVAVKDLSGDPLVPLPPLDLEEGEISTPFDLEEGEIFEAQPPRPPSDIDRAFDDLFATQLSNYATSTRRRERKRRCIRPDEAFGERNTGRIKSSQALASLAAQYADSDGEQQLRVTSGAAFRRQGKMSRV